MRNTEIVLNSPNNEAREATSHELHEDGKRGRTRGVHAVPASAASRRRTPRRRPATRTGERRQTAAEARAAGATSGAMTENSLDLFLRAARAHALLTADEEIELAQRIERGDLAAKERMINSNLRLVVSQARRYQGHGLPLSLIHI